MQMNPAEIFFKEDLRRVFLNLLISISVNSRTCNLKHQE